MLANVKDRAESVSLFILPYKNIQNPSQSSVKNIQPKLFIVVVSVSFYKMTSVFLDVIPNVWFYHSFVRDIVLHFTPHFNIYFQAGLLPIFVPSAIV